MKTPHIVCAALLLPAIAASAYQLGRRESALSHRASAFSSPRLATLRSFDSPAPGSSASHPALARAEAALAVALATGHWHRTPEWDAIVQSLSASDLQSLVPAIAAIARRSVRDPLLATLATRWGECDPLTALTWAKTLPEKPSRDQAVTAIMRGWAHGNPDTLVAWLRAQPADAARRSALQTALSSLTQSRPSAALDLIEREREPTRYQTHYPRLFRTWAASEPRAAATRAQALKPEFLRPMALHAVIESWSDLDPVEAIAFARTLPKESRAGHHPSMMRCGLGGWDPYVELLYETEGSPIVTGDFTGNALGRLAQKDPDAALAAVRNLPSGRDRERALRDIALSLLAHDPGMATAFAAGMQASPAQTSLLQQIAVRYAQADSAGALTWAQNLPAGTARTAALHTIAVQLAATEPSRGIDLLRTLPEGAQRTERLHIIASTWAEKDPAAALGWARSLTDPTERSRMLESLIGPWARHDASAALAFALEQPKARQASLLQTLGHQMAFPDARSALEFLSRIPSGADRNAVLHSAINALAYGAPGEAATLIARSSTSLPAHVVGQVAQQFAASDLPAAIQWAVQLPAADARDRAVDGIARSWAGTDPESTARWVSSLPPGPVRDAGTGGYVDALAYSLPDRAAPMALTIGDPTRRNNALERVASSWLNLDRPAASTWLATAPLAPDLRRRLLAR